MLDFISRSFLQYAFTIIGKGLSTVALPEGFQFQEHFQKLKKRSLTGAEKEMLEECVRRYPFLKNLRMMLLLSVMDPHQMICQRYGTVLKLFLAAYLELKKVGICSAPVGGGLTYEVDDTCDDLTVFFDRHPQEFRDIIEGCTFTPFFDYFTEQLDILSLPEEERIPILAMLIQWCITMAEDNNRKHHAPDEELKECHSKQSNDQSFDPYSILFGDNFFSELEDMDEDGYDLDDDDFEEEEEPAYTPRPYDFDTANMRVFELHILWRGRRCSIDIQVREDMTFEELHKCINKYFQHSNKYLYAFYCSDEFRIFSPEERGGLRKGNDFSHGDVEYLGHHIDLVQDKLYYFHDLAVERPHEITVRNILSYDPSKTYPVFLKSWGKFPKKRGK